MVIELKVRKVSARIPAVAKTTLPPDDLVLARSDRFSRNLRRRRVRRLQHALGTAAWVTGGAALLFFAAAGVLSLH